MCLFCYTHPVRADVTWSGEVAPDDPATWDLFTTDGHIGITSTGTMNITNGSDVLNWYAYIGYYSDSTGGDGFINMATGGMLALNGDADDSLTDFLGLVNGTDAIRYWDDSISDWADIAGATYGQDYTLSYLTEGDLSGYTMLTVTAVPEPATLSLFALGAVTMIRRKHKGMSRRRRRPGMYMGR